MTVARRLAIATVGFRGGVGGSGVQVVMPAENVTLMGAMGVSLLARNEIAALPAAVGIEINSGPVALQTTGSVTLSLVDDLITTEVCS